MTLAITEGQLENGQQQHKGKNLNNQGTTSSTEGNV